MLPEAHEYGAGVVVSRDPLAGGPAAALRAFQADLFRRQYDYDQLFTSYAEPVRQALAKERQAAISSDSSCNTRRP
jgi:hypothetical protein